MAAQIEAIATNSVPPLKLFSGRVFVSDEEDELGVVLQKLARKAFPESGAKEFDHMLKGCFTKPSYRSGIASLEPRKLALWPCTFC